MTNTINLIKILEDIREYSYIDMHDNTPEIVGDNVSVGLGFNMDAKGARDRWNKALIPENFDNVYHGIEKLSKDSAIKLFIPFWKYCEIKAKKRAEYLGLNFNAMPEFHRFVLTDIAYNTGSVSKWRKVFISKNQDTILFEARRKDPDGGHSLDSRVAKIGHHFGIIPSLEYAHHIGLDEAKYLI